MASRFSPAPTEKKQKITAPTPACFCFFSVGAVLNLLAIEFIDAQCSDNRKGNALVSRTKDYVKVANGTTEIHYYDDRLRPILEETYGTIRAGPDG